MRFGFSYGSLTLRHDLNLPGRDFNYSTELGALVGCALTENNIGNAFACPTVPERWDCATFTLPG
jgi:hypothetical protein